MWAKYGQKGDPGTSINILGSYDSLEELNSAKDNGTLKGNNPPLIGDSYLVNGDIYIWDGDEFINGGRLKGEPGESVYFHIKYSDDGLTFTSNNGETIGKFIGTRVDSNPIDSMVFSDYTWSQFRGNDGFGYEYIFQRSKTFEAPDVPTENTDTDIAPYGWTDDPTGVDMEYKYEWCCYRQSDENGKWGPWKGKTGGNKAWLFAMYAEGIPGATGKQGPIIYPAGIFDSSVTYTQDIKINDKGEEYVHSTPYVLYNGEFYILQVESFKGSKPTTEDGSWLQMDKFSAVYTEILLANNALVGSAVFNGDYIFSQQGIDARGYPTYGDEFKNFNHSDPYNESNAFRPNWCVDLKTGEQWIGAGNIYFDSDGNAKFGENEINVDGTGQIANGDIKWDNSEIIIGNKSKYSSSVKINDYGLTVADVEVIHGETNLITEIDDVEIAKDSITISHRKVGGTESQVIITADGITKYSKVLGETYTTVWPSDDSSGGGGSSNIQFVDSLPNSGNPNTLYVLI